MTVTEEPTQPGYKWVGSRPIRPDGLDKVTGKARFGADLKLPGMLEGAVLRSPHAHAKIVSIDTSAAEAMPGVKAVITGADFPDLAESGARPDDVMMSHNIIARDKVLYEGHVVAAVAAATRKQARAAADAIEVTYEVLPHVLTVDEALADDAPVLHDGMITKGMDPPPEAPSNAASRIVHERGELDKGFADADAVAERTFTTKPVHQGYIEPHAAVADAGQNGRANVWCSSQGHFAMRTMTATVLGWEPTQLKVTPAEIGGGFGGKTVIYLEPLATMLSLKARPPGTRRHGPRRSVQSERPPRRAPRSRPRSGSPRTARSPPPTSGSATKPGHTRLPRRRRRHDRARLLRHPQLLRRRLRRGGQQAEGRGLPSAGGPDGSVRGGKPPRRARPRDRDGPPRAAAEERRGRRNPGRLRTEVPPDRLRRDHRSDPEPRALQRRARREPGSRRRRRVLVQRWHELERHGARQRRRQPDRGGGLPRHRRQPGVDGTHGSRGAGDRRGVGSARWWPTPKRSGSTTSPAAAG